MPARSTRLCVALLPLSLAWLAGCATSESTAPAVEARATPPRQFPARDFFAKPERAYFRLSDDGKTLGYMQPVTLEGQRRMNIFVQKLEGGHPAGEARQLTQEKARDVSNYFFKGNDRVLYVKDFGGDENFHVVSVDIATGRITDLTPGEKVRAGILDDLPEDPDHIIVEHNRRDARVFDVFRIDLATGRETLVAQNPGDVVGWQPDHAGRVRMAVRSVGLQSITLYRPDEASEFKPIITTDYRTEVEPQFFDAQDRNVYMVSNRGRDKKALVRVDPARPDAEEVLFVDNEVDVGGAVYSRARKRIAYAVLVRDRTERKFFDPYYEDVYRKLEARFPGMEVALQSFDKAEDKFIVAAFSDRTPGARYVYDTKSGDLFKLGDINPRIPAEEMAPMKSVKYTTRDGLTVHAYLTLPVSRPAKNLACVVNPHGGPWARDQWGYNPEVQLLANRGYCVFQMNFRGSTGFGRKFWEASFGQWGLAMQDDITDGVKWLVDQGIADPKRIGIYGGSYGGYATLAGITKTPELYAAAVDYVGVSNLFTFMNTIPPYWKPLLPKFYDMVGDPQKDVERLRATSPVMHVDRIRTPLLIVQGARDPRVNKAESDQVVEALKKRGVDVAYMVKDNEGHGFRNEENQFEFYEAMEKFFQSHMAP
jgi:dipeptidyl aminopeptidase/acylaminoacyl peptidase